MIILYRFLLCIYVSFVSRDDSFLFLSIAIGYQVPVGSVPGVRIMKYNMEMEMEMIGI